MIFYSTFLCSIADTRRKACKQQTLWLSKYEDAWPIRTYMSRFLYARASQKRNLIAPIDLSFSHDRRGRCSVTEQSYVPRPTNVDALNDDSTTSLKDLLEAMHIGEPEFMAMQVCLELVYNSVRFTKSNVQSLLRRLADKYLDTSAPLSIQERGRKDALVREVWFQLLFGLVTEYLCGRRRTPSHCFQLNMRGHGLYGFAWSAT